MALIPSVFDVVAGVSILIGDSSLMDKQLFTLGSTKVSPRRLLGVGFLVFGSLGIVREQRRLSKIEKTVG